MTLAIRAFALDWIANPVLIGEEQAQDYLTEAEQEALRALQLGNTKTLALAFYAEILVDQQKWTQAEQYIQQARDRDPTLMDVHRVYAYVLESLGQYNLAITEYDKPITIAPNFTFLHLRAGANYRRLAFDTGNVETYNRALEYFDKDARINEQLGVNDPVPYLSIAKTYSQMGQFFIAARNVERHYPSIRPVLIPTANWQLFISNLAIMKAPSPLFSALFMVVTLLVPVRRAVGVMKTWVR